MRTSGSRIALLALAAAFAGCASHDPAAEARYDASLAHWKGKPESDLLAHWGTPAARIDQGDSRTLTFVVRDAFGANNGPGTGIVRGGAGAPRIGGTGATMNGGVVASPGAPLTCTTRFVLRHGVVDSWTFDGVGCAVFE